jgi:hypothetical protein
MVFGGKTRQAKAVMPPKNRFAVGAQVIVINPGVAGVVTQVDEKQTVFWEYWHRIQTEHGEYHEPGSNLEMVPTPKTNAPAREGKLADNIHLYGNNARFNVGSTDNSTNIVYLSHDLFVQMKETAGSIANETEREAIISRLNELEKTHGSNRFLESYQKFVASLANHMTLFAPFMPALAQLLSHSR